MYSNKPERLKEQAQKKIKEALQIHTYQKALTYTPIITRLAREKKKEKYEQETYGSDTK